MKVGFIGVGRMGSALLDGFVGRRIVGRKDVLAFDKDAGKVNALKVKFADAKTVVSKSDVVFLCVKPQNMNEVLEGIKDVSEGKLFVSIAAGISTRTIESKLEDARVVRVMPNTPALVGEMAAGYALGSKADDRDGKLVEKFMDSVGACHRLEESLLDAVTGLSGSGPAYVYYFIKALADAGVKEGIPDDVALKLAAQTTKGAAEMILSGKGSPEKLIENVKSPGGTTIEGMKALEEMKFHDAIFEAVKRASARSRELGK
ncbi:MAG: pyrroline-5-carboxylate reductase [Candidatus Altiarchaeota archaeon]|nr:pyrroline-5-carboxylate reductase [Candidatus Altiarchaeota archaeon]